MDEERAKDQASGADGEDVAGSLESLLEEEGLDLGDGDEALSEDDLDLCSMATRKNQNPPFRPVVAIPEPRAPRAPTARKKM